MPVRPFKPSSAPDWILARGGNDTVTASVANLQQNDRIDGGDGIDHFVLTGGTAAATLTLDLTNPANQLSGLAGLTLSNFEQFDFSGFAGSLNATGSSQTDEILAGAGNAWLSGGLGNDTLKGGLGADVLIGGGGNDSLYLGADRQVDRVVYNAGDGSDTVYQFTSGKGGDLLEFRGIAAIDIVNSGSSTFFRLSDGIEKNSGFGTGQTLLQLNGVTGLNPGSLQFNVSSGNAAHFLFK
jgi:Ca2+-binding RTX toxin-like protein